MTMGNAFGFVVSRKDVILRYVAAMPLLVPGAFLLTVDLGVYVTNILAVIVPLEPEAEPHPLAGPELFFSLVIVGWVVLVFWATATDSIRRTVARACCALCAGGFLFPIVGIQLVFFQPPDPPDMIFTQEIWLMFFTIVGVSFGILMRIAAILFAPRGSPERSGGIWGIWYVFRPIGGKYFVLVMALVLIVAANLYEEPVPAQAISIGLR